MFRYEIPRCGCMILKKNEQKPFQNGTHAARADDVVDFGIGGRIIQQIQYPQPFFSVTHD